MAMIEVQRAGVGWLSRQGCEESLAIENKDPSQDESSLGSDEEYKLDLRL